MSQGLFRLTLIISRVVVSMNLLWDHVDFTFVTLIHFLELHLMALCMIQQILNSHLDFWRSNVLIHIGIVLLLKLVLCLDSVVNLTLNLMALRLSNFGAIIQVQGQMAVGDRPWCDFIIYTTSISIERIYLI